MFLVFSFCGISLFSQDIPVSEAQAAQELENKGISQEELKQRLLTKGIDIDNIPPERLLEVEPIIKQTVDELEQEKKAALDASINELQLNEIDSIPATIKLDEGINQSLEEAEQKGASTAEAISEALSDEVKDEAPDNTVYGQEIFRNQSLSVFRTVDKILPPDSYVLGPGDKIGISIWGVSEGDFVFTINDLGYIKPNRLPRIFLKGTTFGKAKDLLKNRFASRYIFGEGQFSVTINSARTLTVNIFGEILNNGSFTISAINTAFNALVAAGGPTNIGSLRKIKLIRNGKERILDVYEFLFNPSIQYDYFLENNDLLFIPIAEKIVSINGQVKRPANYELVEGEDLTKLIEFAGGLTTTAYTDNIQVMRVADNKKVILDVNLSELIKSNQDFPLQKGDVITIKNSSNTFIDYVAIEGAVKFPGRYELKPEMKISDLIEKGLMQRRARTDIAFLLRLNQNNTTRVQKIDLGKILVNPTDAENVTLKEEDRLIIYSASAFTEKYNIEITGEVRFPLTHPYDPEQTIRVEDAVFLAGGLKPNAAEYAYIRRKDLTNSKITKYVRVNLLNALSNPAGPDNIQLMAEDQLQVFSKEGFSNNYTVSIDGAVRRKSSYPYDYGMRVQDVIFFSGGLNNDALDFGYIIRSDTTNSKNREYIRVNINEAISDPVSLSNRILEPNDQILVLSKSDFTDASTVRVNGAVRNPGEYRFDESLSIQDVITLSGGMTLSASYNRIDIFRLIIEENKPTRTEVIPIQVDRNFNIIAGADGDFKLKPFDQIMVRNVPEFEFQENVTITGEIQYPGTYGLVGDNYRLYDLIKQAGGLTNEAFPEGTTHFRSENNLGFLVTHLDDVFRNTRSRFNYVLKDGDVITIPKDRELVTINLQGTQAIELYPEKILDGSKINVAHLSGKNAKWYVNNYAAGVSKDGKKKLISVEHLNGELKQTKRFLFFKFYPKVRKGSEVSVGVKPPKPERQRRENKEPIDWNSTLTNVITQATAVLTLILLTRSL